MQMCNMYSVNLYNALLKKTYDFKNDFRSSTESSKSTTSSIDFLEPESFVINSDTSNMTICVTYIYDIIFPFYCIINDVLKPAFFHFSFEQNRLKEKPLTLFLKTIFVSIDTVNKPYHFLLYFSKCGLFFLCRSVHVFCSVQQHREL